MHSITFLLLFCPILLFSSTPVKIACVGDELTFGTGMVNRAKNAYPQLLQEMLGDIYEVRNYGVEQRTVRRASDASYWATDAYREALAAQPEVIFVLFGEEVIPTDNQKKLAAFEQDYLKLVRSFQRLASQPRVVLLLPPVIERTTTANISDDNSRTSTRSIIQKLAWREDLELIDLQPYFAANPVLLQDQIHLSSLGAAAVARRAYTSLVAPQQPAHDLFTDLFAKSKTDKFNFHGFVGTELQVNGRASKIVQPKKAAPGNPWVWRARFWGHEPQTDIALLERGFHVVYTDVADLFGNQQALQIWDNFYDTMIAAGLSPKAVLEGMSRGGLIVYRWAAKNPEKVAAIYADAPVLDVKSWPGGLGEGAGSTADWQQCLAAYGFTTEKDALRFAGNPVDLAADFSRLQIPLLHICGLADAVVPYAENTGRFAEQLRANGGAITLIHKPNIGHHPHSLIDPTPIVDFILRATGQQINLALVPQPASEYRSAAGWRAGCDWHCNNEEINQILDSLPQVDLLLLGNSITQGTGGQRSLVTHRPGFAAFQETFADYRWVNAGISGDRTEHILWRLQQDSYHKAAPKIILLTIGVNNFPHNSATEIVEGILAIAQYITEYFPDTRLLVSGVLPTGVLPDSEQRQKYVAIHQLLAEQLPGTIYFPIGQDWLLPSGKLNPDYISPDGIHLVEKGYQAWAKAIYERVSR